jgi:hypothetical protein
MICYVINTGYSYWSEPLPYWNGIKCVYEYKSLRKN